MASHRVSNVVPSTCRLHNNGRPKFNSCNDNQMPSHCLPNPYRLHRFHVGHLTFILYAQRHTMKWPPIAFSCLVTSQITRLGKTGNGCHDFQIVLICFVYPNGTKASHCNMNKGWKLLYIAMIPVYQRCFIDLKNILFRHRVQQQRRNGKSSRRFTDRLVRRFYEYRK